MKIVYALAILFGSFLMAEEDRDVAANFGREDSGFSDEYKLYDRNNAGLDWNRYSYPSSNPPQQPYFNK